MRFTKMHGIGNDYVYVDGCAQQIADPVRLAIAVSDRHFGIGSDGLILIVPPEQGVAADVRMRMFNADGSESEMCGNGVRCVAKFAHDHDLSRSNPMRVQTGRGVLTLSLKLDALGKVEQVTVDMGAPILNLVDVPVIASAVTLTSAHTGRINALPDLPEAAFVSMGNPHATFFVPDVKHVPLEQVGPHVEHAPAFPRRINAHFVQVHSRTEVSMRTWERGSGVTLACGTGACAVCVSGVLTGRTDRKILAHLPGGDLILEWEPRTNTVLMTGPAAEVFAGEWPD